MCPFSYNEDGINSIICEEKSILAVKGGLFFALKPVHNGGEASILNYFDSAHVTDVISPVLL